MITVGIASYNQQDFLSDAIESVINQTAHCEIIVCNDGSTDNSLEIARKYPVKVVDQVNKGLSSARNSILMNATGEYILFLDSDDILLPNCVEKLYEEAVRTNADVVAGSFKTFGTSNQEVVLMPNPMLSDFKAGNRLGYSALIKRSVLLEVGGYSPRMVEGYEDLAWWCLLLSRGKKIVTIPDIVWLYRTKDESMYTKITPEIHKKLISQINKDIPSANLMF
jgi:glycosyltransferase involved in cell wall biosynthesis